MTPATGFALASTSLPARELRRYYAACCEATRLQTGVGHSGVPVGVDIDAIAADPAVRSAVAVALPGGGQLVHRALHLNPSGAEPLGWHSDDCQPWFDGPPAAAPPAVRIWFFPQDVPLARGPLALIPTGGTEEDAVVATLRAGGFIAVYDMALVHRQMPNRSGHPRFMVRLEWMAGEGGRAAGGGR